MHSLLDDYGQAVVLIVFGAGLISLMGMLLGNIVSGKVYLKEFSAFSGLQERVRTDHITMIESDNDPDADFSDIDFYYYGGR